jgi:mRNA interferase MazF
MESFEQGDIVRVPFPYTDKDTRQRRPALVISSGPIAEDGSLLWVMMITSAENRPWQGDVSIPNHERAGLPAASVIRPFKITTIDTRHAARIGRITKPILQAVIRQIRAVIAEAKS